MSHEIDIKSPYNTEAECRHAEEDTQKLLAGRELPDQVMKVFLPQDSGYVLVLGRPGRRFILDGDLEDIPELIVEKLESLGVLRR